MKQEHDLAVSALFGESSELSRNEGAAMKPTTVTCLICPTKLARVGGEAEPWTLNLL